MQLSYDAEMEIGKVGNLYDISNKIAKSAVGALAIPFGRFVCRDADDNKVKLPLLTGDVTGANGKSGGIALATHALESVADGLVPHYPALAVLSVLEMGKVLVLVEEAVVQGEAAFVRFAAREQVQTLLLSADLVASNVYAGKVNGNYVSVTYATSHAATLTAMAALIATQPGIKSAVASVRTITVTTDAGAETVLSDFAVTLGASQATVTLAETVSAIKDTGSFRKSDDSSSAVALPGAYYGSSAGAGELAVLLYNIK